MDATTPKATAGISAPGWQLTLAERALIDAKSRAKRLGFAAMLLFFRDYGRFPRGPAEIGVEMVTDLARVLDVPTPTEGEVFPFGVAERDGQYDVMCTVKGGGLSGQAGAVKHGIAQALTKFEPVLRAPVKAAGFLTRDSRAVERKKYGKAKARKSFQFSKR